jgi:hypothetical protein
MNCIEVSCPQLQPAAAPIFACAYTHAQQMDTFRQGMDKMAFYYEPQDTDRGRFPIMTKDRKFVSAVGLIAILHDLPTRNVSKLAGEPHRFVFGYKSKPLSQEDIAQAVMLFELQRIWLSFREAKELTSSCGLHYALEVLWTLTDNIDDHPPNIWYPRMACGYCGVVMERKAKAIKSYYDSNCTVKKVLHGMNTIHRRDFGCVSCAWRCTLTPIAGNTC